jgi:hypothetical protein
MISINIEGEEFLGIAIEYYKEIIDIKIEADSGISTKTYCNLTSLLSNDTFRAKIQKQVDEIKQAGES